MLTLRSETIEHQSFLAPQWSKRNPLEELAWANLSSANFRVAWYGGPPNEPRCPNHEPQRHTTYRVYLVLGRVAGQMVTMVFHLQPVQPVSLR